MLYYITTFGFKLRITFKTLENFNPVTWPSYVESCTGWPPSSRPSFRSPSSHSPILIVSSAILPRTPYSETWTPAFVPKTLASLSFRSILTCHLHRDQGPLPPEEACFPSRCNLLILTSSCRPLVILLSPSVTFSTLFAITSVHYHPVPLTNEFWWHAADAVSWCSRGDQDTAVPHFRFLWTLW